MPRQRCFCVTLLGFYLSLPLFVIWFEKNQPITLQVKWNRSRPHLSCLDRPCKYSYKCKNILQCSSGLGHVQDKFIKTYYNRFLFHNTIPCFLANWGRWRWLTGFKVNPLSNVKHIVQCMVKTLTSRLTKGKVPPWLKSIYWYHDLHDGECSHSFRVHFIWNIDLVSAWVRHHVGRKMSALHHERLECGRCTTDLSSYAFNQVGLGFYTNSQGYYYMHQTFFLFFNNWMKPVSSFVFKIGSKFWLK